MYVRLHIKSAVDQPVISRCPDKMGWDSVVLLGGDGYLKMKGICWSQRQTMTDYIFQGWPQHSSTHMFFPSHPICSFHPICSSHPIPYALPTQYVAVFPSTGAFSTWPQWVGYAIAWQAEYDKQFPGTDLGGPSAFFSWPLEILALERPMHGTQSLLATYHGNMKTPLPLDIARSTYHKERHKRRKPHVERNWPTCNKGTIVVRRERSHLIESLLVGSNLLIDFLLNSSPKSKEWKK